MTKEEFTKFMDDEYAKLQALREAGQKEYAGGEDAFGNFNRLASRLGIDRKQVLWVYLTKHFDGIESYVRGHVSQREPVEGRINDAIVYLTLLKAMVVEAREKKLATAQKIPAPGGIMTQEEFERHQARQMTNIYPQRDK